MKQSDTISGMSLTKCRDDYEVKILFSDNSDFKFKCKFKEVEGCTVTVGVGQKHILEEL